MPQTTVSLANPVAVAGMLDGPLETMEIETFIAAEDLSFGRMVRIKSGETEKVEVPSDDSGTIVGMVVYKDMLPQLTVPPDGTAIIKAGTPVAVLRKGRAWAAWDGAGTVGSYAQFNIRNNTAAPTTKGMVTAAAASTDVVRTGTRGAFVKAQKVGTTLALIAVNFP